MSNSLLGGHVRRKSLSADEIAAFAGDGYLNVGQVLSEEEVQQLCAALVDARERERERGQELDLLDPGLWPADDKADQLEPGKSVGFLFNLWLWEPTFRSVAFSSVVAGWAAQLIGSRQVRLLEDNALYKEPHSGGELKWHQDYSYWPLAQPNAITIWIALDHVRLENGAVRFAKGSHLLGERLPAVFGTGTTYLSGVRPATVSEIGHPEQEGLLTETMILEPGEASFHHGLTWHASGPNSTEGPRRAYVVRYVGDGTIWLGERRYAYNYSDAELGVAPGSPLSGRYFPIVPF